MARITVEEVYSGERYSVMSDEIKLAEMIERVKAEIAEEKAKS